MFIGHPRTRWDKKASQKNIAKASQERLHCPLCCSNIPSGILYAKFCKTFLAMSLESFDYPHFILSCPFQRNLPTHFGRFRLIPILAAGASPEKGGLAVGQ